MATHNCFDCGHPVKQHSGRVEGTGCRVCGCQRWFEVTPALHGEAGEGRAEVERLKRLGFVAGAEYMKDSIRRTRHGQLSHAGSSMVAEAATAYSKGEQ